MSEDAEAFAAERSPLSVPEEIRLLRKRLSQAERSQRQAEALELRH